MNPELEQRIKDAAAALKARGAKEVYLFGSAATGTMHNDSDIDMAVSGLPPEVYFSAMGEASWILQRPLDLMDLDQPNAITRYLIRNGKLQRVR